MLKGFHGPPAKYRMPVNSRMSNANTAPQRRSDAPPLRPSQAASAASLAAAMPRHASTAPSGIAAPNMAAATATTSSSKETSPQRMRTSHGRLTAARLSGDPDAGDAGDTPLLFREALGAFKARAWRRDKMPRDAATKAPLRGRWRVVPQFDSAKG